MPIYKLQVQLKYLSCVAATCFYIAAKVHQESEVNHNPIILQVFIITI